MSMKADEQWWPVATVDEVPEDDVIQVTADGVCIALFNVAGDFYATAGICTHAQASLAKGFVQDDTVECPLHRGVFHIPTGKAMGAPVTKDLRTYKVKVEGGRILVAV
jgi:nitrite reductase/ring-hydroxylating ferredoxin subunit